jgi:hypothetical protein
VLKTWLSKDTYMSHYLATPRGPITIRLAQEDDSNLLHALRIESLNAHPEAFAADIDKVTADGVAAFEKLIAAN